MQPNERDWSELYTGFKKSTGLDLNQYKQDQLRRRIINMAQAKRMTNLGDLWKFIAANDENLQWFQDKLAINVTELFRNPEKWNDIATKVLPELLQANKSLKCWSAGCSIGAEAHTLALLFEAHYPGNHKIDGTDIDAAALAQAKEGRYSEADMRGVPGELRKKYFVQQGANEYLALPPLKKYLSFRRQNLLNDQFETGYDLIMCRNVVIYFNDDAKDVLYQRFFDSLRPGGYLFVGSTERIFSAQKIGFECPISFIYKKPNTENKTWRNAS